MSVPRCVKLVWQQNAIDAQRPDAGWSGSDPPRPQDEGRYLAFGSRGLPIRHPELGLRHSRRFAVPAKFIVASAGTGLRPRNGGESILFTLISPKRATAVPPFFYFNQNVTCIALNCFVAKSNVLVSNSPEKTFRKNKRQAIQIIRTDGITLAGRQSRKTVSEDGE